MNQLYFDPKSLSGCSGSATSAKKYEQGKQARRTFILFYGAGCALAETNGTKRGPGLLIGYTIFNRRRECVGV